MVHSHKFHWDCSSGSWSTVATRLVQMNGPMNERMRQMDSNAFADSVGWSRRNEHCVASLINKHCTFCAIIYKYVQAVLNHCRCQSTLSADYILPELCTNSHIARSLGTTMTMLLRLWRLVTLSNFERTLMVKWPPVPDFLGQSRFVTTRPGKITLLPGRLFAPFWHDPGFVPICPSLQLYTYKSGQKASSDFIYIHKKLLATGALHRTLLGEPDASQTLKSDPNAALAPLFAPKICAFGDHPGLWYQNYGPLYWQYSPVFTVAAYGIHLSAYCNRHTCEW